MSIFFQHDTDFGVPECEINPNHYIMYPSVSEGTDPNNKLFSSCSRAQMWGIIQEQSADCFQEGLIMLSNV